MGFVTPISRWFAGPLAAAARDLAGSPTLARTGWFDMPEIGRLVTAHQSGKADHGRQIWQFFMLEKSLTRIFGL
jgi:asparagine synthase (glutamine-hydrolysing)